MLLGGTGKHWSNSTITKAVRRAPIVFSTTPLVLVMVVIGVPFISARLCTAVVSKEMEAERVLFSIWSK